MNIFKNRPLFCGCMLFIVFSVIFYQLIIEVKVLCAAISLFVALIFIALRAVRKIPVNKFITPIICCLFVILSSVSSILFFDFQIQGNNSLADDQDYLIEGVVLSESYAAGASSEYTILVTSIDGKAKSFKANLECEYIANIQAGNEIRGHFKKGKFEEKVGAYMEADMMLADGILVKFVSDSEEDMGIYIEKSKNPIAVLSRINARLSYRLVNALGDDIGGVCSALFLGNKDIIPTSIKRDFRRAGASHILAISGMHMSIIFGVLAFILKKLFMPYKPRAVILSLLAVFYLAFTGFSISATRSIIMLLIVYLSMICSYQSDSLTSLSVAGVIILAFSPYALLDAGFWMSFAATFGILVYIPTFQNFAFYLLQPYYAKWKILIAPIRTTVTLILTSICAIAPLVIVFCIFTQEVSLFSVPSSLLLGLPTEALLILTPLYLIFMKTPILGKLIEMGITACSKFMTGYCEKISLRDDCIISLNYEFTAIAAVILGVVLFLCLALKFKRRYLSPIPFVITLTAFLVAIGWASHQNTKNIRISYVNQSDDRNVILANNGEDTVLFDMTPGYYTSLCCAYNELSNLNATEIDCLVLTKYTTVHISSLSKSFQSERIRKLYIPKPESNDDYFRMTSIMECAKDNGVIVDIYEDGEELYLINGLSVRINRETISRSTVPITMLSLKIGEETLTYISPSYVESNLSQDMFDAMENTDHLIFGSRGPTPKQKYKIQNGFNIKTVIFSTNKVAAYYDTSSCISPDTTLILSPEIYRFKFSRVDE